MPMTVRELEKWYGCSIFIIKQSETIFDGEMVRVDILCRRKTIRDSITSEIENALKKDFPEEDRMRVVSHMIEKEPSTTIHVPRRDIYKGGVKFVPPSLDKVFGTAARMIIKIALQSYAEFGIVEPQFGEIGEPKLYRRLDNGRAKLVR